MGKKGNWRVHSNSPIKEGVDAAELEVKVMDRFDDIRPLAVEEQKKPKQKGRGWSVGTLDEKEPEKRRDGGQHRDAAVLSNSTFAMYMWAAVVIQTAFRDYLARKSLRALRGLQSSGGGHKVMRQASTTTHALVHIQAHREGLAAQHQMWQRGQPASRKASDGLTKAGWITSTLSAQQIEARVPERQVAALKRERALAYARTQQMRRASPMFVECEVEKAHRGWSYTERGSASKDAAAASKSVDVGATRNAKDTNFRHASLQAVTPPPQALASSELNFRARSGPWNRQSRAASPQSCDAEESGSMAEAMTASGAARSMASILTDPQFGTRYSNSGPARNGMIMDTPMVAGHLQATQSVKNKERSSRQLRTRPVGGTSPGAFNTPATMKRLSFTKADHSITPWSPLPRTGPV